jgi:pimeloyl-ACP methyl ester carboxylesterase
VIACAPVRSGTVDRGGVPVAYDVYGAGEPTVLMLMPDLIVHSRAWKAQVPFLSRHARVVTLDPRGNGRSGRPGSRDDYRLEEFETDAWAVLDEVGVEAAVLVGVCTGAGLATVMAAARPERVLGVFAINPGLRLAPALPHMLLHDFEAVLDTDEGWAKLNQHFWRRDWAAFAQFFFGEMFPEPHSTKQVEDAVGWAVESTPEIQLLEAFADSDPRLTGTGAEQVCRLVRCPVLVVSGSLDRCQNLERGRRLAELTGGEFVLLDGCGHLPNARDPVKVNLLLRDFVRRVVGGVREDTA